MRMRFNMKINNVYVIYFIHCVSHTFRSRNNFGTHWRVNIKLIYSGQVTPIWKMLHGALVLFYFNVYGKHRL